MCYYFYDASTGGDNPPAEERNGRYETKAEYENIF